MKIKCGGGKFLKKVVVVNYTKYLENRGVFIIYQGGSFGQNVGERTKIDELGGLEKFPKLFSKKS